MFTYGIFILIWHIQGTVKLRRIQNAYNNEQAQASVTFKPEASSYTESPILPLLHVSNIIWRAFVHNYKLHFQPHVEYGDNGVKRKKFSTKYQILTISTKLHPNPPSNLGGETCGGQIRLSLCTDMMIMFGKGMRVLT